MSATTATQDAQEKADGFNPVVIAFTAAATVGLFVVTASVRAAGGHSVFTAYLCQGMAINFFFMLGLETWRRTWARTEEHHWFVLRSVMILALIGAFKIAFAAFVMFSDSYALATPEYQHRVACEKDRQTRLERSRESLTRAVVELRQCEDRKKALAVPVNLSRYKGEIDDAIASRLHDEIETTCDEHLAHGKELVDTAQQIAAESCEPLRTASR